MSEFNEFFNIETDVTLEAQALAARCVEEKKRPGEIEDISEALRKQAMKFLRFLGYDDSINIGPRIAEEEPRLQRYAEQYRRWQNSEKTKCPWTEVRARLLANNGYFLSLASAMVDGGILFGLDQNRNPLVADGGDYPILCNRNYNNARRAVYFKGRNCREKTGYEMFTFNSGEISRRLSPEILAFQRFTGKPFIQGPNDAWASSWLYDKSSGVSQYTYVANTFMGGIRIDVCRRSSRCSERGVRRLLRVLSST